MDKEKNKNTENAFHEEEIDLVDLLGVVIKRRRFVVLFIILFTFITSSIIFLREYSKSGAEEKVYNFEYALSSEIDLLYLNYMFVKKGDEPEKYKSFLEGFLYPASIDKKNFNVVIKNLNTKVVYVFSDKESMNDFLYRYNLQLSNLKKLHISVLEMSDETISVCQNLISTRSPLGKDVASLFRTYNDWTNCNIFNYYFSSFQGFVKEAINVNISFATYIPFLSSIKSLNTSSLKTYDKELKKKQESSLNKRKLVKYSILLFILSIMISLVSVFIMEFWDKNKDRLKKYY